MDVAGGIPLPLKFLIDFQKAAMSLCDKDVAKASARAVSSIAWHCPKAYLKRRRVTFIRSRTDTCLSFPMSRRVI